MAIGPLIHNGLLGAEKNEKKGGGRTIAEQGSGTQKMAIDVAFEFLNIDE